MGFLASSVRMVMSKILKTFASCKIVGNSPLTTTASNAMMDSFIIAGLGSVKTKTVKKDTPTALAEFVMMDILCRMDSAILTVGFRIKTENANAACQEKL